MKILLVNPSHPAIGSRIPREHLPPLGLLSIGGPLLDAGHTVQLLDADLAEMAIPDIVARAQSFDPDAVLLGHSGSTSAHPGAMGIIRALRLVLPQVWIVYGGVFPTYHWREIMEAEPNVDFIVRGEGEETALRLMAALQHGEPLAEVRGIAWREGTEPAVRPKYRPGSAGIARANAPAPIVHDLDRYRVGWELIEHRHYTYYGKRRAVVVQFSRGCPHHCHYCGQHGFWRRWRHRDPVKFARELARLHREQGVELINLADENPTADRDAWKAFLEALMEENVPVVLIGTTRASDIVRDADILPLYRKAGVARLLLGLESTDEKTLRAIHKGSTTAVDREAIRLLRQHGIISMAAWVAGFAKEEDGDYWRTLRQLLSYDPDQIQALYATPHRWTPFALEQASERIIQPDLSKWDYKHQVLESRLPAWRVLLWVKLIETICQLRPRALARLILHPDPLFRAGMRWYSNIGRRVWCYEIWQWMLADLRLCGGPTLEQFLRDCCGGKQASWRPHHQQPALTRPFRLPLAWINRFVSLLSFARR